MVSGVQLTIHDVISVYGRHSYDIMYVNNLISASNANDFVTEPTVKFRNQLFEATDMNSYVGRKMKESC